LAFRDIAEERNYQNPDGAPPDPGLGDGILGESRRRRAAFAKQYLDKLVNIEVDVPKLTTDRAAEVSKKEEPPPVSWLARVLKTIWGQRWVALGAAVAIFACVAGYYTGIRLAPITPEPEAVAQQSPQPAPEAVGKTGSPPATGGGGVSKLGANGTTETITAPPPVYQQGGEPHPQGQSAPFWLIVMMAVIVVLVAIRAILYARREDVRAVEKDSESFQAALRIWLPVVEEQQPTPRSVKRFLNRVRFLACLQQLEPEGTGPTRIPESILIALAALYKLNPRVLADQYEFDKARDLTQIAAPAVPTLSTVDKARLAHEAAFHNWGELASNRARFLDLLPGFIQH